MDKPILLPALDTVDLRAISSNLPAGDGVDVAAAFIRIFGDEAQARLLAGQVHDLEDPKHG